MDTNMPPGKAIPGDVLELMSEQELAQARQHLTTVYDRVIAAARADSTAFIAQRDAWQAATASYVREENDRVAQRTAAAKRDLERMQVERLSNKTGSEMRSRTILSR